MANRTPRPPIAVVGLSALFPGSSDVSGFWRDILAGRDLISDVPPSHWLVEDYYDPDPSAPDKTYAKRGAFLSPIDFDPMEHGVPPTILPATDTSQLLSLILAKQVLDDATRGQFAKMDASRASIILGVTSAQELVNQMASRLQRPIWQKALREQGLPEAEVQAACDKISASYVPWQESSFPGLLGNVVAGRIANRLNLGGTNCVTDAACASSLSALAMSLNELYLGDSDLAICGGVDTLNDIFMFMCFSKTPALSPTGDCRPFSAKADGTMLGEGLGFVALKRLDDAERDGDRVYAVIRGLGSSSDGRAKSVYAPVPQGQAKAIKRTYEVAGYGPESVELVEAHGTGTRAGDAAELAGLELAFGDAAREDKQWCALGSVKSQIGHTKSAAGAAGLIKMVLALHHKVLPPTIKVDEPNPDIKLEESPFYINTEARPWVRGSDHPRRASVSSFGFGGSNFHVALEEYTGPAARAGKLRASPTELFVLSADSPEALAEAARKLPAECDETLDFWGVARRHQELFDPRKRCRLAVVAADAADLKAKLDQALPAVAAGKALSLPTGVYHAAGADPGKVAFVFPGQGSQYLGMGAQVSMALDEARAAWDRSADTRFGGLGLHQVVFPPPVFGEQAKAELSARLTRTEWAQPAIGLTSLSLLGVLEAAGVKPDMTGGHSFGEVTALHVAGAIDEASLLHVARRRGELMAAAATEPGAMLAVAAPIDEVRSLLSQWGSEVTVANHNGPKQVVLSGAASAIADVEQKLSQKGLTARKLPVSTAFHSPLVAPSSEPFLRFLEEVPFSTPSLPVYANSEAAPYPADVEKARRVLAGQIASPVRFVEQIEAMYAAGARTFVEVGPGSVLTQLVSDILAGREHQAVSLDRKGQHGLTSLWHALGRLAVAGVPLHLAPLWASYDRPARPKKKAALSIPISGTNYGKPYPPPGGAAALPGPNPDRMPMPAPAAQPAPAPSTVSLSQQTAPAAPAAELLPQGSSYQEAAEPQAYQAQATAYVATQAYAEPAPLPGYAPASGGSYGLASLHASSPVADGSWTGAYQEVQRQTAEAHAVFLQSMAESHAAFLRTAEASLGALGALAGGPTIVTAPQAFRPAPAQLAAPAPRPQAPAYAAPAPAAFAPPARSYEPAPAPLPAPIAAAPVAPAPVVAAPVATPAPAAAPAPAPAPAAPSIDLQAIMLQVVAEKTGYPAEMLQMDMALEADLGIDSIKRVEILSAMQERAPGLPQVQAREMAALKTLGQIVEYLDKALPKGSTSASTSPASPAAHAAQPAAAAQAARPASPGVDLKALMLQVVAEKTGYPAEMLQMDMALEADLGIDSIKRVEILSAMQERAPGLPQVQAREMAALKTLGQIVAHLDKATAQSPSAAPAPAAPAAQVQAQAAAPAKPASPGVDLKALMLQVVAEKTGYPAEMLQMDMALEADLGIDSIKRVEILSAMQERAPGLPQVQAREMAALKTLGQIVAHLDKATAAPQAAPAAEVASKPSAPIERLSARALSSPATGLAPSGLFTWGPVVVTDDGAGVAAELCSALGRFGLEARVVAEVPSGSRSVIFLGGLREADEKGQLEVNREAFRAAKACAPVLSSGSGLFVTVQDTGGDFGLSGESAQRPWLGGLSGLAKTAALEWPEAHVKAIDLERGGRGPKALAEAIAAELVAGGLDREVGLRASGERLAVSTQKTHAGQGPLSVDERSVIVATGGARGVTAATLIGLAKATKARFALLGRTPLSPEPQSCQGAKDEAALSRALLDDLRKAGRSPSPAELRAEVSKVVAGREVRATLEALKKAGSDAVYLACDAQNEAAVAQAMAEVRQRFGAITGLVHGAGVLADKLIAEKTQEQFDRVFDTKVQGLRALFSATASDPISFICLFSSVAGRYGNPGQCDYAMANEVLNKVACAEARRRGGSCVVKSLDWGPWEGGMVTPALKAHFQSKGVSLIGLEQGAALLVAEARKGGEGPAEVVLGGALEAPARRKEASFDVLVNRAFYPSLDSHRVNGVAVVPAVLVMEWFVRAACALRPDLSFVACRDLRVLRGVRVEHYEGSGQRLSVTAKEIKNGSGATIALELRGEGNAPHYSAQVEMATEPSHAPRAESPVKGGPWPWQPGDLYGELLFHGPDFQVIQTLEGLSPEGATATLLGAFDKAWTGGPYRTDPAALDGGLQLARLWGIKMLGRPSLPTQIGSFVSYAKGPLQGPIGCAMRAKVMGEHRTLQDLVFTDARGAVIAEMRGVEMHMLAQDSQPKA